MFSYLRSFCGPLAHPLGMFWLLLMVVALYLFKKRQRLGALFFVLMAVLLSLIGGRTTVYMLGSLEEPYVRKSLAEIPNADAIVLLGGTHEMTKSDLLGFNLNDSADRILMAMELARLQKAPALAIGGGHTHIDGQEFLESGALIKWMTNLGATNAALYSLPWSRDTHDEALHTAALARTNGWKTILLVTSGFHMKRAEATFRSVGLTVVPVACDFQRTGTPYTAPFNPFPIRHGMSYLDYYLHEIIGWWVYRWRGWISADAAQAAPGN